MRFMAFGSAWRQIAVWLMATSLAGVAHAGGGRVLDQRFVFQPQATGDGVAESFFGHAVAMTDTKMIVGAPAASRFDPTASHGIAMIYAFGGGAWEHEATLQPAILDGDEAGWAVDIDGNLAVVGVPATTVAAQPSAGLVYVYREDSPGTWNQIAVLQAPVPAANDRFGSAVSIDAANGRIMVGAPGRTQPGPAPNAGAAFIFTETPPSSGSFGTPVVLAAPSPSANDGYGISLAILGTQAFVGAPFRDLESPTRADGGEVYRYTFDGSNWNPASLTPPPGILANARLGVSIALSSAHAVFGAPGQDDVGSPGEGAVYAYDMPSASFGEVVRATGAVAGAAFGRSVAVAGANLIVGAPAAPRPPDLAVGAFVMFEHVAGNWEERQSFQPAPNNGQAGVSVAVGSTYAVAGAPTVDTDAGASAGVAYLVELTSPSFWEESGRVDAGNSTNFDDFGIAVAIDDDSPSTSWVAVGAPGVDAQVRNQGKLAIFRRNGLSYTFAGSVLNTSSPIDPTDPSFGRALDVEASDPRIVVGESRWDRTVIARGTLAPDVGRAHVFRLNGSAFVLEAVLESSATTAGDETGYAVAIDGDSIALGAPFDDDQGPQSGSVTIFRRSGLVWGETQVLIPGTLGALHNYGWSIDIDGTWMAIGAPGDDSAAPASGRVYMYELSGGTWQPRGSIPTPNGTTQGFGYAVAIDGSAMVVGAPVSSDGGRAFVYRRTGITWSLEDSLLPSTGDFDDAFGASVGIAGQRVIVSASGDELLGDPFAGSIFEYTESAGNWTQASLIQAPTPLAGESFGFSVALSAGGAVAGGPFRDETIPFGNYGNQQMGRIVAYSLSDGVAATCVWNGSFGSWDVPANWSGCAGGSGTVAGTPGLADRAVISSGAVTIPAARSVGELRLEGGTINGTGDLTVADILEWESGRIESTTNADLILGAGAQGLIERGISNPVPAVLDGRDFQVLGNLSFNNTNSLKGEIELDNGANIRISGSASFNNSASPGPLGIRGIRCVGSGTDCGSITVLPGGSFDFNDANGAIISINQQLTSFDNQGTVRLLAGCLGIDPPGVDSGTYQVDTSCSLAFFTRVGAQRTWAASTAVTGLTGRIQIEGAMELLGTTRSLENWIINPIGRVFGPANLNVTNNLIWRGEIQGPPGSTLSFDPGAEINIGPPNARINQRNVINNAEVDLELASLTFENNAVWTNNAFLDLIGSSAVGADMVCAGPGNCGSFVNNSSGSLISSREDGSANSLGSDLAVQNNGLIRVTLGRLALDGPIVQSATGILRVDSSAFLQRSSPLPLGTGTLSGTGTVQAEVQAGSGTIRPGASPGILSIIGDLQMSPSSRLIIDIGGVTPGSLYDRLVVNGTANLAGSVDILQQAGFNPAPADQFEFLQFDSATGSIGIGSNAFPTFVLQPNATNVRLVQGSGICTWTGSVNNDWTVPGNWANCSSGVGPPVGTPGLGNTAVIGTGNANLPTTITVTNLSFTGGVIDGPGALNIGGNLSWTGGVLRGDGSSQPITIQAGATATVNNNPELDNRRLIIDGTLNMISATASDQAQFRFSNGAILQNRGLTRFETDEGLRALRCGSPANDCGSISNDSGATFRLRAGPAATGVVIEAQITSFENNGTVELVGGCANLAAPGTDTSGTYVINGGCGLTIAPFLSEERVIDTGVTISGSSNLRLQGPLRVNGTGRALNNLVIDTGGVLRGPAQVNLTGTSVLKGAIEGSVPTQVVRVPPGASMVVPDDGVPRLRARRLVVDGSMQINGLPLALDGAAEIDIVNGVLNLTGSGLGCGSIVCELSPNCGTIRVGAAGALSATGSGPSCLISSDLSEIINDGQIVLQRSLSMNPSFTQSATGSIRIEAPASLVRGTPLTLAAGALGGNGSVSTSVVNNGATIKPGLSPGLLSINGDYTQTAGEIEFEIGGTALAQYDRIAVTGNVTLAGGASTIQFGGFTPAPTDVFQLMSFASRTGTLTLTGNAFPAFQLQHNTTDIEYRQPAGTNCIWNPAGAGPDNWSNPAKWSGCGGGTGTPAGTPGAPDSATINSGTPTLDLNVTVSNLTITGGVLSGAHDIEASSSFLWSGGEVAGTGIADEIVIGPSATANLQGGQKTLRNRKLWQRGNTTWTTGLIELADGAQYEVASSATLVTNPAAVPERFFASGLGTATLRNFGAIQKIGPNVSGIGSAVVYDGTGSIDVVLGTFTVAAAGTFNGTYSNAADGILAFTENSRSFGASTPFDIDGILRFGDGVGAVSSNTVSGCPTVAGQIEIQNAALVLNCATPVSISTLRLLHPSAELGGSALVSIKAQLEWPQGALRGSGGLRDLIIDAGATLAAGSGAARQLDSRRLLIRGNGLLSGGTLRVPAAGSAAFEIDNGGGLQIGGNTTLGCQGAPCSFPVNINGSVTVDAALVNFEFIPTVTVAGSGSLSVDAGTLALNGVLQTGGSVSVNDRLRATSGYSLQGGTLSGFGTLEAVVTHTGGSLSPGSSPGIFTIEGSYTLGAGAVLNFEIGGTIPGSQHDQLVITGTPGTASFGGAINVAQFAGFSPAPANVFDLVTFASRTGTATLGANAFPAFSLNHTATRIEFRQVAATPPVLSLLTPSSGPAGGGNTVSLTGTNFVIGATTVLFGSAPSSSVSCSSTTRCTALVPAGAGDVDVKVVTAAGSSVNSLVDDYAYRSAVGLTCTQFTGPSNTPVGDGPFAPVAGRFDADLNTDLAVSNQFTSDSVSILLGNGSGGFTPGSSFPAATRPMLAAVGFFNADTFLDLAVPNEEGNNVFIRLGDGTGSFAAGTTVIAGDRIESVAVADLNADGRADLVTSNRNSNSVSVALGNGDGTFAPVANYTTGSAPRQVVVSDFNEDGRPDVVTANSGSASVSLLLGNGDGSLAVSAPIPLSGNPYGLATGDLTGDGRSDLLVSNSLGTNVLLLAGNGSGGFAAPQSITVGTGPNLIATGDFNADGIVDIAVALKIAGQVALLQGEGGGSFAPVATFPVGTDPVGIVARDFDGDGRTDLATANEGSDNVSVLTNNGCAPTISGLAPSSGPASGGTNVTVTGTNLAPGVSFSFGPNPATILSCPSITSCSVTSPPGTGIVDVIATTAFGSSPNTLADDFVYGGIATTTTITLATPNPAVVGEDIEVTVEVRDPGATLVTQGSVLVRLLPEGTQCTINLLLPGVEGMTSCAVRSNRAVTSLITAQYQGTPGFAPSLAAPTPVTINRAPTSITIVDDSPDPSVPGQAITVAYNVEVDAPGTGVPSGSVLITDGVGSCTAVLPATTCNFVPKALSSFTLEARYLGDENYEPSSDTEPHTLTVSGADLSVLKRNGLRLLPGGRPSTYLIRVNNAGPGPVSNARVTDILPPQLANASWTCSASGGASCPASGTGNIDALVSLPAASTLTFQLTVTAQVAPELIVTNTATVTPPLGTEDPLPGNNSSSDVDAIGVFGEGFETEDE